MNLTRNGKRIAALLFFLVVAGAVYFWEEEHARLLYAAITPFPEGDYWETLVNALLRDVVLLIVGGLLFLRRKRIPDRLQRYFPAVVLGILYLGFAWYMCGKLALDTYFLTTLAILAGLMNNIFPAILAAVWYHRNPSRGNKLLYFAVYFVCALLMLMDMVYFWQTTMHVQAVFFRNFNIYAIEGVMSSFSKTQLMEIGGFVLGVVLLFRVTKPRRHKPNAAWALLAVLGWTLCCNLLYYTGSQVGLYALHESGLWSEEQIEKSRQEYRDMLATPIAGNIISKALFNKEKVVMATQHKKKELTDKDREWMYKLGVVRKAAPRPLPVPAYDRIVMLILESVHRDYIHCYNSEIPAEATPFLDSLIKQYPRIDNYYSSAVPTTEGLNATFRSQLLFDGDVDGSDKPSLFRSMQEHGFDGYFQSASSRYYNNEFRQYTEQFGMAHYEAREDLEKAGYSGASGWGFHNDEMYRRTLEQLKKLKGQKYFYVTKTLDMHQPYPYYATKWEATPESFRNNQIVTVHGMYWVDCTLRNFFKAAEEAGLMDERTLYIITSDHNPHSGGEYTQLVKKEQDRLSVAPIPLIFVSKNTAPLENLDNSTYASQIDIAPTLLCLQGIKPPDRFIGRNLLQQYREKESALGFFGDKAYYFSRDMHFVDKIDEPYPQHEYEDALANFVMYTYYVSGLPAGEKK
ncbi:MAG: sulfatase-like hydrolase/transferase [Acidaminococcaceae bacterium]|nr:sulfatase-like hydrolase/transferase [Acidaminococcaceae bacterium]